MRKILPMLMVMGIAVWSVWPVIKKPATAFAYGGDDGIITWQLNQTIQKIPKDLGKLFDGNIFYPYKDTTAYHMLLVPSAILGYLPVQITGSPVAAYNTALIAGQILTMLAAWLWFREMSHDDWSGAAGAVVLGLCQIRMFFSVHIHMWIMQWMLVSAWMLWRYTQNKKTWQLYVAGAFLAVQFWESIYQAYWILIMGVIILWGSRKELWKQKGHLAVIAGGVLVLISPVLAAFGRIYGEFGFGGSIREAANFSMSVNELWQNFWSPSLYVLMVVAILKISPSLIPPLKVRGGNGGVMKDVWWLAGLMIMGVVLALGPVLKWEGETVKIFGKIFIPLPYGVLYYLVPGFSVLRSVHRFVWLAALGGAGIIAVGFHNTLLRPPLASRGGFFEGNIRRAIAIVSVLLVAIVGGTTVKRDLEFPRPENYPAVYGWLASQPGKAILEYPVYMYDQTEHGLEMYRMVYSLKHKKGLIGGASGFMPPDRQKLLVDIRLNYPNKELDGKLSQLGVDYVVVHKEETTVEKLGEFARDSRLGPEWEDEKTIVYRINAI
jgi:hypothetical protein